MLCKTLESILGILWGKETLSENWARTYDSSFVNNIKVRSISNDVCMTYRQGYAVGTTDTRSKQMARKSIKNHRFRSRWPIASSQKAFTPRAFSIPGIRSRPRSCPRLCLGLSTFFGKYSTLRSNVIKNIVHCEKI